MYGFYSSTYHQLTLECITAPKRLILYNFYKINEKINFYLFIKVRKVLKDLDLEKIIDAQAKNLSGGQKRKLSVGIAILGDPKVNLVLYF